MKYRNLSHSVDVIIIRLHELLGKRNKLSAKWWGIKLGRHTEFDGKCYFRRFPGSEISVGNNCKFLSRPSANLIGINRPCIISTLTESAVIEIGDNCGFSGAVIGSALHIKIGKNVRVGANALITDTDWHNDDPRSGIPRPVNIGNNVWLGGNSVVLKGVNIGENSVIGANSVVTHDIPVNVIAAGNPCKIIRPV